MRALPANYRPAALPLAAFAGAVFLTAVSLAPNGDDRIVGAAAGVYLLSRLKKGLVARILCAAVLLALIAVNAWGALLAVSLLMSILLAEMWSGDGYLGRAARFLAMVLCFMVILWSIVPAISPYIQSLAPVAWLPAVLAFGAIGLELVEQRAFQPRVADPLLVAFSSAVFIAWTLAVAVLAVGIAYPQAILLATVGFCSLVAAVMFLSGPFTGSEKNLSAVQHIFALQVPIEQWVGRVSAIAAREFAAADFTAAVMREFLTLPGVVGVSWRFNNDEMVTAGDGTRRHHVELQCPPLFIRLHTRRRASPWDWFNYYLLARIAAEYSLAKQREELSRADNLLRAVHETGARLTHDIKNILHALVTLTESTSETALRRQLPLLRQRLEDTLRKLQTPDTAAESVSQAAADWWAAAARRYQASPVSLTGNAAGALQPGVFDLALDNFIGNALIKKQTQPALVITATLMNDAAGEALLRVTDDGAAVPEKVAAALFRRPVASNIGFGVGLYQVAIEAKKSGYEVSLENNTDGRVVFCLRRI